jgi:putative DNA primase/helicase
MVGSVRGLNTDGAIIEQFLAAMREHGIDIDEPIVADGKFHRYHVAGDRARTRNAWAKLVIDEHPAGMYGCNKRHTGEKFTWTMKGARPLTPEERRQIKATAATRAAQRQAEIEMNHAHAAERATSLYEAAAPVTEHPYLALKGVPSSARLRVGRWYWIDEETGEEVVLSENALLVPMMDPSLRIHSLQAIWDDGEGGFRKQYLKNGTKEGKFVSVGKPRDNTILIAEGLATGLSLWQCTAHAVVVAFDAGNLIHVAKEVRRVFPEHIILLCADNDAWTHGPIDNPGVHFARAAASAINGLVIFPEFVNTETKPTDFNDLHQLEGEAIVREFIDRALVPPAEAPEVAMADEAGPIDPPAAGAPDLPSATPPGPGDGDGRPEHNGYFSILGYDHDVYYFFQHEKRQVLHFTYSQMHEGGFIHLAALNWWEENFPGKSDGINKKGAMEFLMRTANKRGIFKPDNLRGRGAWYDNGRSIYHHGQYLTVDGATIDVTRIKSRFVYELGVDLPPPADVALTDDEGHDLLGIAEQFRWSKPGSAALLMGWITLAPLCGALKWRPHIWLTGNAGSGKSTIVESFVNSLLDGVALYVNGSNSTEPGVRQKLRADALPVIIDESEQNEERDVQRMQSILSLMRQSSSASQAKTYKGTTGGNAMDFNIRSMFCLASIQVGVKHKSDSERISILTLKPAMVGAKAAEQWEALKDELHRLIVSDPDISMRLFRRSLDMLPTILKNIEVFKAAAARVFKSQRAGDQYGTLLAGCWALINQKEATTADAEYLINAYEWKEHVDDSENDEAQNALAGLLESHIRGPRSIDFTVYEALSAATNRYTKDLELDPAVAAAMLGRHGMKVEGKYLILSNASNELRSLMENTSFKADWRGVLLRLPGADRNDNKPVRMNGAAVKVTRISLSSIFVDDSQVIVKPAQPESVAPF